MDKRGRSGIKGEERRQRGKKMNKRRKGTKGEKVKQNGKKRIERRKGTKWEKREQESKKADKRGRRGTEGNIRGRKETQVEEEKQKEKRKKTTTHPLERFPVLLQLFVFLWTPLECVGEQPCQTTVTLRQW